MYKIITEAIKSLAFLAFYKLNSDFGCLNIAEELVFNTFSSKNLRSCKLYQFTLFFSTSFIATQTENFIKDKLRHGYLCY